MHKVKEHLEKLECFQSEVICKMEEMKEDVNAVSTISDIIKDIADAMKCEAEAAYYKCLAEELHEEKEEEEMISKLGLSQIDENETMGYPRTGRSHRIGKMGYDNYRYASGRFAPKGRGHYAGHSGYTPNEMPIIDGTAEYFADAEIYDPTRISMMPMGYTGNRRNSGNSSSDGNYGGYGDGRSMNQSSQYGRNYDNYQMSRRHYTETKDEKDKEMMRSHAKEHLHDVEHTVKDIWKSADPDLKKEMKANMEALVNDMRV